MLVCPKFRNSPSPINETWRHFITPARCMPKWPEISACPNTRIRAWENLLYLTHAWFTDFCHFWNLPPPPVRLMNSFTCLTAIDVWCPGLTVSPSSSGKGILLCGWMTTRIPAESPISGTYESWSMLITSRKPTMSSTYYNRPVRAITCVYPRILFVQDKRIGRGMFWEKNRAH